MSRHLLRAVPAAHAQGFTRPSRSASNSIGLHPSRRASFFLLAIVLPCFLLGCGVQGELLPPRVERPVQVADLTVVQKGQELLLSFTPPELATDGERLTKPLEIQIFRTITPQGSKATGLTGDQAPWTTLSADDLRHLTTGKKVIYSVKLSDPEYGSVRGKTFTFAVRGVTHGFRNRPREGEISSSAGVTLLDVSAPVTNLRARATETAIELEWSPPAGKTNGEAATVPAAYRIFRSPTGGAGSFIQLAETRAPKYLDNQFRFDHSYHYKVRAVFKADNSVAESEDSETVEITPHDVFPPAPPQNVTALYAAGAVEILWTASTEPDLAGYNVLRREAAGAAEQINKELLHTPIFRDETAQPDRRYFYQATSVDLVGNESTPSAEVEVETR